ncbi:MAG: hypothetical protein JW779_11170 [Candidatus Thorarchaeota archaeon]|nr:hypothetical protein [Candidatus Thorarchaeota archaeon]
MSRKVIILFFLLAILSLNVLIQNNTSFSTQMEKIYNNKLSESSSLIWHDDCSNTSSFPDLANAWYNGAMGDIASANGYIYATNYGSASGEHGPVYYHTFTSTIPISQLDWIEAEIQLDGSSAIGAAAIMLYDSDYKRIAILDVADSWIADNEAAAYAGWYDVDFNAAYTPKNHPGDTLLEPYRETLRLEINSTGLFGLIPRVGEYKMLDVTDLELEREISYLCVQFRQKDSYTPCQTMKIYDIQMKYRIIEEDTTSSTITHPPDMIIPPSHTNYSITWLAYDLYPATYNIYQNGSLVSSRSWDNDAIIYNLTALELGTYEYLIVIYDTSGNSAVDVVMVFVREIPNLSNPLDYQLIISIGAIVVIIIFVGVIIKNRG